jgi:ABC-2 type transport system permease protein
VRPRALVVSATTAAQRAFAERSGLIVWGGFYIAVISVLGSLWRAAAGGHGGMIAGYSGIALSWYVATSEAAIVALNFRMIEDIGIDIASGSVAVELLRPASVLAIRVASEIGRALARLAIIIVIGMGVVRIVAGPPVRPVALLLVPPSLVLAISCNIVAQHVVAALAFWARDARSGWFIYSKLVFVIGGMLLPLEVLPHGLMLIAKATPLMAMAYAPARLAAGHVEPILLAQQLAWLGVLWFVAVRVFDAGERRLQTVGG